MKKLACLLASALVAMAAFTGCGEAPIPAEGGSSAAASSSAAENSSEVSAPAASSNFMDKLLNDFKSDGRSSGEFSQAGMGEEMTNAFFSFKVNSAKLEAGDDTTDYLAVNITVTSVFEGEAIPMADTDFEIFWDGQGENDPWAPIAPGQTDTQLPETYELDEGESATGDLIYAVPKGITEYMLYYLEVYEDDFEGNGYGVSFDVEAAA